MLSIIGRLRKPYYTTLRLPPGIISYNSEKRRIKERKTPQILAQTLRDMTAKWLKPEEALSLQMFDMVVLEQFIWDLEVQTQN